MQDLVIKHRNSGALLDTNLLVLRVIGSLGAHRIETHPRTKGRYREHDFAILNRFLSQFKTIWTTASILTEVSNLCFQKRVASDVGLIPIAIRNLALTMSEFYVPISTVVGTKQFDTFGFTDANLLLKHPPCLFLTDDLRLTMTAHKLGIDVFNFNFIRDYQ